LINFKQIEVLSMTRKRKPVVMSLLYTLFFFIGTAMAQSATYYVAQTGLDSNPGTSASPFLTIQKCVNTMVAGDICLVGNGTYTVPAATRIVASISGSSVQNGTAQAPITLKSLNPRRAVVQMSANTVNGNSGFYVAKNYWTIDGFEIKGGVHTDSTGSDVGIVIMGITGTTVRNNVVHNIATTICSNDLNGNAGMYFEGSTSTVVDSNLFYTIGRLLNGENGCSTYKYANDHGLYVGKNNSGLTVTRNIFYDVIRGYPIHIYGPGATNAGHNIYNNTFANHSANVRGHIILAYSSLAGTLIANVTIKNNISYDGQTGMVECSSGNFSNIVVSNNLSDSGEKTAPCPGTVTFSNNLTSMSPGFVDALARNYTLNSGSPAIDRGVNIGLQFIGTAPDIGRYEFGMQGSGGTIAPPRNLRIQ
jgi:hypothetical protein